MTEGLIVWEELLVPAALRGPWEPWTGPFARKCLRFPPRPCHTARVGRVWPGSSPVRREADPLWGPPLPPPPQAGRGGQGSRTPCFWAGAPSSSLSTGGRAEAPSPHPRHRRVLGSDSPRPPQTRCASPPTPGLIGAWSPACGPEPGTCPGGEPGEPRVRAEAEAPTQCPVPCAHPPGSWGPHLCPARPPAPAPGPARGTGQ